MYVGSGEESVVVKVCGRRGGRGRGGCGIDDSWVSDHEL